MRKRHGVILAIVGYIVFFFCIEGWGADWKHYYSDNENDAYYDAQSMIHQKDGWVKVWIKTVLKRKTMGLDEARGKSPEFLSDNITKELLRLMEINCPNRTFRNLAFHERDRDGRLVWGIMQSENDTLDTTKVFNIIPDSGMERIFNIICK